MATFLGIDWGQKKVGVATADESGVVITPCDVYLRNSTPEHLWYLGPKDIAYLKKFIEEHECTSIILGLPLLKGNETSGTLGARQLAESLNKHLGLPIELVDESLSTWSVQNKLEKTPHMKPKHDDSLAAAQLLEDFFHQKKSKNGSITSVLLLFIFISALLIGSFGAWKYYSFAHANLQQQNPNLESEILIDIAPGANFYQLEQQLQSNGISVDRLSYRIWLRLIGSKAKLKYGEYLVKTDGSLLNMLTEVNNGKVLLHKLTIKEGENIYDISKSISLTHLSKHSESFDQVIRDPKLLKRMGVPLSSSGVEKTLEGFLFPETYTFQKYDSPRILVESMLREFERRALPWTQKHPWGATAEGRYRLVTLASIVEKESGVFDEQPVIASVFWNRLNKKMRLESDPTIIYGFLPDFDGNIRRHQIRHPHPYNTYTVRELPVGPIANPGEHAIKSVVEPASSEYLFFVSRGDGSHVFTTNYKDHNKYVQEYQVRRRRK